MKIDLHNKTVLISRTDSIGDVVLTIPLCIWLKKQFPSCKIIFLGNTYTEPVLACFKEIDQIIFWKEVEQKSELEQIDFFKNLKIDSCIHAFPKSAIAKVMKKVKIPNRIGTSHRLFHLLTCNIRPNFTRKNSDLHESQLNFELLKSFGLKVIPSLEEINGWMNEAFVSPTAALKLPFSEIKDAIILHPKSQGSAIEWPIEKYISLANELLGSGEKVIFSGTEQEGLLFRNLIPIHPNCFDATGKMTLNEFIVFIAQSKTLVACSTGPLHIAGIAGIHAIGFFSARRPIHAGRWRALGNKVSILEFDPNCVTCKKGKKCTCLQNITVEKVRTILLQ